MKKTRLIGDKYMKIEKIYDKGIEYINAFVNKSSNNGQLHFSHEILVTFVKKENNLIFDSAWHCGVSEMEWDSSEENLFEKTFPGLLSKMRNEIRKESTSRMSTNKAKN